MADELLRGHPDVSSDLSKENRGDVPARVIGNRGAATIGVSILQVRAPLPGQAETKRFQDGTNLTRLQDW